MAQAYHAPALQKAVRILRHLADRHGPSRLSALARALGYSKSTVHGILRALESAHWVERDAVNGGYRLGEGLLELSRRAFGFWELPEVARPLMERLAERLGESVFLGTRQEDRVIIIACVEGRSEMRVTSPPGTVLPLLAAATGKIFMADLSPQEAWEILQQAPLPRFTHRSIQDPEAYFEEVERARRLGYAMDDEEYLRGIRAVAVPIRCGGRTVAAIWVVGFVSNLTDEIMQRAAQDLVDDAAILCRLLESRSVAGMTQKGDSNVS